LAIRPTHTQINTERGNYSYSGYIKYPHNQIIRKEQQGTKVHNTKEPVT